MTDVFPRIKAKAKQVRQQQRHHDEFPAQLIAVENENGVSSVMVNDDDNKVWIIAYDDNARPAQAWNLTTQYRAGAPVWVRRMPNNTLEVVRLRPDDSTELFGTAAPTLNTPDLIGELMPNTVWPGRSLLPGRLRSTDVGGLIVYVEPFHYDGGFFSGDTYDLTPHVPATADKKAWVKIWVDPASNTVGATNGDEVDLNVTMDQRDLAAITIDPSYIPVAGVILTNGDTTINEGMVYDARQWLNAPATPSQLMPVILDYDLTIPANRQIPIRRLSIVAGGVLHINGVVDIF